MTPELQSRNFREFENDCSAQPPLAQVAQEQTRLSALFANFTHADTAAATQLGDEAQEIDSEARRRPDHSGWRRTWQLEVPRTF